jgi:hypothetical protein
MTHTVSFQSTGASSHISKHSSSKSSLTSRKQLFAVIIGSSILISIVGISIILCFFDRLHKKTNNKKSSLITSSISNCPYNLANGKRIASSSPLKTRYCYEDESPTHNYTNFKSMKSITVIGSSSQSSSSADSATRINTAHNRSMNATYSYTAIGTSDELMPDDFDDENTDGINSGIELMMTTV